MKFPFAMDTNCLLTLTITNLSYDINSLMKSFIWYDNEKTKAFFDLFYL